MRRLVSALILQQGKVLLALRKNTKEYADFWSVPVGHVEGNESDLQAIKRELKEELGIKAIKLKALHLVEDKEQLIRHQVFHLLQWQGSIENKEPHLCHLLDWFPIGQLPEPITAFSLKIISQSADYLKS
ncbi:MAG: NUDIX domain-containing protein [Enterobacterales bacterium]|nr:NUDIX domain-containing protein [Enterobacterales bacterium]